MYYIHTFPALNRKACGTDNIHTGCLIYDGRSIITIIQFETINLQQELVIPIHIAGIKPRQYHDSYGVLEIVENITLWVC